MLESANILVCSDFSRFSDEALKAAEVIRKKSHGTVHVLHVTEFPVEWSSLLANDTLPHYLDEKFDYELLGLSEKKLKKQIEATGVIGESHVSLGLAYSVIEQFVKDHNINLLIMGHKGKEASPFRLGGLTEKMVASSAVPILVINSPLKVSKVAALFDPINPLPEIIVVGEKLANFFKSNFKVFSLFKDAASSFIGLGKLSYSTKLLSLTEIERQAVIKDVKEEIRKHLTSSAAELVVEVSVEKKVAFHLNSLLQEHGIDLAIIKKHQAGFLESMMIGSETRRLLEISQTNLFILN